MTELLLDHLELGERIEHTRFQQLREHDHRPTYTDLRMVESSSGDHAYLVGKVACLDEPFDPEETDIAADMIETVVCSCPQFHFRCSADFEVGERKPSEFKKCKHYRREFRAEKAQADDSQQELGE